MTNPHYPYSYNLYCLLRYGVPVVRTLDPIHDISVHLTSVHSEIVYVYGNILELGQYRLYNDGEYRITGHLLDLTTNS